MSERQDETPPEAAGTEKIFKMVAYFVIIFVIITVLVLLCVLFVQQRVNLGERLTPCICSGSTGNSGISSSHSLHQHLAQHLLSLGATCDKTQICFTGPTGAAGKAAFTGGTGDIGPTGPRGSDLIVNAYGNLTEAVVSTIESSIFYPQTYRYVVEQDNRVNKTLPVGISGDMSLHLIYYDGMGHWEDWGPYTGLPGEMGPPGGGGVTGADGARGAVSNGDTGPTGVMGPTGATGNTGLLPMGDLFGDGTIWPYPTFLYGNQKTVLTQPAVYLTGDTQFDDLVIDAGCTLYTMGYRMYVRGILNNAGTIRNDGQNGLDAGGPSTSKGGTGGIGNTFRPGGDGGYSNNGTPGIGGTSPFAYFAAPQNQGGAGGDVSVPGGAVVQLNNFRSWALKNALMEPVPGLAAFQSTSPPIGTLTLSAGSGGSCSAQTSDGIPKAGAGGGGGVVAIFAAILQGNGLISAKGGDSGNNTLGGRPSGGGGGGYIVMRLGYDQSTMQYNVSGGRSLDINSPGGINPTWAGFSGLILLF